MNGIQEVSGSIPLISTKREPGEPNADNNDGRRGVCPGLSIGTADGQIMKNRYLDIQVAVFYAISISEYDII